MSLSALLKQNTQNTQNTQDTPKWSVIREVTNGRRKINIKRSNTDGRYLLAWGSRSNAFCYLTDTEVNSLRGMNDTEVIEFKQQKQAQRKAPKAPSAPNAPTAPKVPTAPTAPLAPIAPTAPSAPNAPKAPKAPTAPIAPIAPSAPNAPKAPTAPLAQRAPKSKSKPEAYVPRDRTPIIDEQGRDIRPPVLPKWTSHHGAVEISWVDLMHYGSSRLVGEHMHEAWALIWYSVIAKRPFMIRGLPGGAKTMMSEMLGECMADAKQAVVQMHPTASAEELLGAPSLRALDYDLIARAFYDAPIASHALLIDEFEKASEPVQQALLSLFAERVLRDSGRTFELPIESLVATSNNDIYDDAVRDRFTVTAWTKRGKPSKFRQAFRQLRPLHFEGRVTSTQLAKWRLLAVSAVDSQDDPNCAQIWEYIDSALDKLSEIMSPDGTEEGLSERRTLQMIDMMGASASSQGRNYILLSDAYVLKYAPPTRTQQSVMGEYLRDVLKITPIQGYVGRYTSSLEHDIHQSLEIAYRDARNAMSSLDGAFK